MKLKKVKAQFIGLAAVTLIFGMSVFASCRAECEPTRVYFAERGVTVKTGIEVLRSQNFEILEGLRVGLITNPTGVDRYLKSTIDILHAAPNVNLVALFAPEHGVRGDYHAGDDVQDKRDPITGVIVHSLHGRHTRKPTPEMLEGIDVLVYDIQDIGCRSYTYISTMGLSMEAAAENGIKFIVLDRPNPLGGHKVEGGLVEPGYISFVSQYPIPYVYGLTPGELALLLNGEGMLANGIQVDLTVVPMEGWTRNMLYEDTGLQWISASPHIPHPISALMYPVSGILGELSYISIGIGYLTPFEVFAAPWIDANELANSMNALNLPGLHFRPKYIRQFYRAWVGEVIQGVQVHIMDFNAANLSLVQFYVMQELAILYPDHKVFDHADERRFRMFDQVAGCSSVRINFSKNHRVDDIRDFWTRDVEPFRQLKKQYWLYQ